MPPKKKPTTSKLSQPIDSVNHKDKRANIPTEELRDFIAYEEKAPKTVLYPRDPSLDPQLVWKGKDEQDSQDLAVPAVPIYIQEHIKPQNIIELVQSESKKDAPQQALLFGDFNGLSFEDRVDFYHHEQHWSNRMILGDSLMVMTSLAEKEGLKGKVQMIYLDPPYGIKFGSNWQVSTRKREVKDGKAEDTTRQPEQVKAFRDTWQLGIHSYLAYLRDRLVSARELLAESGSIFVQIGVENAHLVRLLLDEVFGSENHAGQITFRKTSGLTSGLLAENADYLLWYAKDISHIKYRQVYAEKGVDSELSFYNYIQYPDGTRDKLSSTEQGATIPDGATAYSVGDLTSSHFYAEGTEAFYFDGDSYKPGNRFWTTSLKGMQRLAAANRIHKSANSLRYVRFMHDFPVQPLTANWTDTITGQYSDPRLYVVQTGTKVIQRCMMMTTDPGDLVIDPTCGSGTTAYVAEQWGRRWITMDTSRVSIALARTRLMSGRYPYYLLADSAEGRKKEAELSGRWTEDGGPSQTDGQSSTVDGQDIKRGFVYERVPHVTLKSIANNEEIDQIHAEYQPAIEKLLAEINKVAKKKWQEWEVPRTVDDGPQTVDNAQRSTVNGLLSEYWKTRQERQRAIDATIARRADTEFLYDKPYEDKKRIRVAGPFTVESLSPHRVLATDDPATAFKEDTLNTQDFTQTILENLKTAGVQNTIKKQRLKFERLEPYAGVWIHAIGEYTEQDGTPRRAAISIGPELGTVSAEQIKEAAKEAVRGVGFDILIVCGFAFDPHVSEESKRYGNLAVLPTRMNPDLAMGDELLKKTGAGNLFMVFGEPDLSVDRQPDGKYKVILRGLDVYDPTTGEIRSNTTDDIACWFIDTDYNEETFIVRHAYFTGADEPYDKLKRALRAEIDESAWSALYTNESIPFEKPANKGKIAVKVINHYGDEVLKVYEIG